MSSTDIDPPRGPFPYRNGARFGPERDDRPGHMGWFGRAESWLDERGKGAWIAATVLGFVLFWPVGLALLFYMIWSKRMFSHSCGRRFSRADWAAYRHGKFGHHRSFRSSGNTAFDAYKADTLRRLEEEQDAFQAFLDRLRAAKDKTEFDQFMEDRAARARDEQSDDEHGEGNGDEPGRPS